MSRSSHLELPQGKAQWLPTLVFGLALAVYGLTAPTGLTWANASADGGELITAALVRGIPHPTGYPTWTLLATLCSKLPFGAPAWRIAALSMLSAAAAAACVTATVPRLVGSRSQGTALAAVLAGLTLALSPLLWGQAIVAEVYALHAAFAAAILSALTRWQQSPQHRWAALVGALWGLGLGNHLTLIWLLPAVVAVAWPHRRSWLVLLAALLAGLTVYAYLPLAAAANPPINWGQPRTINGFWWLVSGQLYHGYAFAVPWPDVPGRIAAWTRTLWHELMPWGVVAALAGLGLLSTRQRALTLGMALSLLLSLFWAISYNTSDSLLFALPVWVILALWLGVGLAAALDWLAVRWPHRLGLTALLAAALVLLPAAARWPDLNLRHDQSAEQFYQHTLAVLEPDAVVLTEGDRATFALWYARYGLQLRPDIAPISRALWALPSYRATIIGQHPALSSLATLDEAEFARAVARQQPLYWVEAGETAPAPPAQPGLTPTQVASGDGWTLWRLLPAH